MVRRRVSPEMMRTIYCIHCGKDKNPDHNPYCTTCYLELQEIQEKGYSWKDVENLCHMVGKQSNVPKKNWGYRNYYAAGEDDQESMERLVKAGLAVKGPERWGMQYYYATEEGCRIAGLHQAAIERAMEGIKP